MILIINKEFEKKNFYFKCFQNNSNVDLGVEVEDVDLKFSHIRGQDLGVELEDAIEFRSPHAKGRSGVSRNDSGFYSFPQEHPPVSPRTMGEGARHMSSKY